MFDYRNVVAVFVFFGFNLFGLASCTTYSNLTTAKTLERGEFELGVIGSGHFVGDSTFYGAGVSGRAGLNPWLDLGGKIETNFMPGGGYNPYATVTTADLKFGLLDEENKPLSLALMPGVSIGLINSNLMTTLLVSRRFGRWEPVFAYRPQAIYFYGMKLEDDDDDDDGDDDDLLLISPGWGLQNDLFVGCRIQVAGPFHVFPEFGASINQVGNAMFHVNVGLQFVFK
ncbi:MAG: hypothetical protein P9L99_07585 [Candidatus Lernaella stagnicola]|nr:hypothetical protein [Candidatus Lernaella stagnicola]